jgi:hypothetical protein
VSVVSLIATGSIVALVGVLYGIVAGSVRSFCGRKSWGSSVRMNKLHLFGRTQHRFIMIQTVPLHERYMFQPVLRSL